MFDQSPFLIEESLWAGLGSPILAALKVAVAFSCLAAAEAIALNNRSHLQISGSKKVWQIFAIVLIFCGIFSLINGDKLVLNYLRSDAKEEGWYQIRRYFQFGFFLVALPIGYKLYHYFKSLIGQEDTDTNAQLALRGISLEITTTIFQTVSWHYTDKILNLHFLGISIKNMLFLLAMAMIIVAVFRNIVRFTRV